MKKFISGKIVILSTLSGFAALFIFAVFLYHTPPSISVIRAHTIKGAHRGESVLYAGNSYNAIETAINNKEFKFIEIDLQYTQDGEIVVFHDKSLFGKYGNLKTIGGSTYEEIYEISNGDVRTYDEIIDLIGNKKKIILDIKTAWIDDDKEKIIIDYVVKDLEKRGIKNNVVLAAFNDELLRYINEKYPDMKTGLVYWIHPSSFIRTEGLTHPIYKRAKEMNVDSVLVHESSLRNIENLLSLKPEEVTLMIWYPDNQIYAFDDNQDGNVW